MSNSIQVAQVYVPGPPGPQGVPQFVTALRTYRPTVATGRQTIVVDGYSVTGDGGGGQFVWNATDTRADDGGTIIAVAGVVTGRWNRDYHGAIDVQWYGANGDDTTDDGLPIARALTACFAAGGGRVLFPRNYAVTSPVLLPSNVHIEGLGQSASSIKQLTAGLETVLAQDATECSVRKLTLVSAGRAHVLHFLAASVSPSHDTVSEVSIAGFGAPGNTVTNVDLVTGTLTSNGHGFANGAIVQLSRPIGPTASTSLFTEQPTFTASTNKILLNAHGLAANDPVQFNDVRDAGVLPTGISSRTTYYVKNPTTNDFQISATSGGAVLTFNGSGSPLANVTVWAIEPGGLSFQRHYYVVGATTNTFQLSATSGGSAIVPSSTGTSSPMVGQVFGAFVFEGHGQTLYSPRVRDFFIDGIGDGHAGALNDGGARHGILMLGTGGGVIAGTVTGGEIGNVKRGFSSILNGQIIAVGTHVYNCVDGSGGGLVAYVNTTEGFRGVAIRMETAACERIVNFDFFGGGEAADCEIRGNGQGVRAYMVNDAGFGNNIDIGYDVDYAAATVQLARGVYNIRYFAQRTIAAQTANGEINLLSNGGIRESANVGFGTNPYTTAISHCPAIAAQATTDATTTTFDSEGFTDVTASAMEVEVVVTARRTGGSRGSGAVGDIAAFTRRLAIKNVGGTTSIVGTIDTIGADKLDSDLTAASLGGPAFSLAPSTQFLRVTCTGVANVNLAWNCYVKFRAINS